uniref:PEGA domain-containing protein n=1 Tax=candidate division WOR-3 bacterium TaxID=2052148 RepID=A0A7C4X8Q1_UNCW3
MLTIFLFFQLTNGYLTVRADQDGLPIYVDDDFIGRTPVIKFPLKPDEYNIGFFPQDSIENASYQLKGGNIGALWRIAKYGEGTVKVRIEANRETIVELNYRAVISAPGKTKLKVLGCLGGVFLLGVLSTLAIQAIF